MLVAFNRPYGVLSQFTDEPGSKWKTLAKYSLPKGVYAVGRLDVDSEGFLLLTDEAGLNSRFLDPNQSHPREYWAQIEGWPDDQALKKLETGIELDGRQTLPTIVKRLEKNPPVPNRNPPIRVRKNIPDTWISIELSEGKNRQVRRMTAAVKHPTLRLIRVRMGSLRLDSLGLSPGKWRNLSEDERKLLLS